MSSRKNDSLATRIRSAMDRVQISQADLARAVGIEDRRLIYKLVSGQRPKLDADLGLIARIAEILGLRPEELVGWTEQVPTTPGKTKENK